VELIIVVAIIGILAGVATPMILAWLPDIRLKSAARDLFSQMQQARMQAIKENRDWAIVFDAGNNKYELRSDFGGTNVLVTTVDLSTYSSGVGFGRGAATQDVAGTVWPNGDVSYAGSVVIFTPRGTGTDGYVYLDHQGNTSAYAVGTVVSGSIRLRRWMGAAAAPPWQ